jgi:hypothetical protein
MLYLPARNNKSTAQWMSGEKQAKKASNRRNLCHHRPSICFESKMRDAGESGGSYAGLQ